MNDSREATRKWMAILYPENMIPNWENVIDDILQIPLCYCVHDKDDHIDTKTGEVIAKTHLHVFLVYPNTTTRRNIIKLCNKLSADGKVCCSTAEEIVNSQKAFDYLIHNTEKARKEGKYQYPPEKRICCNNFDIHFVAQEDEYEKNLKTMQLSEIILQKKITNYVDFLNYVINSYDESYFRLQSSKHNYFDTIIKGNYKKYAKEKKKNEQEI